MNVRLGSFAKKKNSTAVPSGGLVTTITGALRDGCSVERPIIGFAGDRMTSPVRYNYAFVVEFARYYFIQDWEWYKGLWFAHMEVDPMATYKTQIGAASCYVLRAAAEKDPDIIDCLYPTKITELLKTTIDDGAWWQDDFSNGAYILGVLGEGNTIGAVNYYIMTPSEMQTFKSTLMSSVRTLVGTTEITEELLKALFNPFQYVVSAIWLPVNSQYLPSGSTNNILLGWWDSGATGTTLSAFTWKDSYDFTFALNEVSIAVDEKYMLSAPYSAYTLFFPPFGSIELDSGILVSNADYETIGYPVECHCDVTVDLVTGMGFIQIMTYGNVIGYKEAMVGIPTQLGQSTQDILGGIQNAISGLGDIGSGMVGLFLPGGGGLSQITAGINGIIDAGRSVIPKVSTSGSNGGVGALQYKPYLQISRRKVTERSPQENGYPLCKTKVISTLPGYVKTMNCDIVITGATDAEQEEVRGIMNGGFFYE